VKHFGRVVGWLGTASLALAPALFVSSPAGAETISQQFTAVGSSEWVVPAGVTCVTAEAIGAEGGSNPILEELGAAATNGNDVSAAIAGEGSSGGSGTTTFPVVPGATVQVNVGGRGGDATFSSDPVAGAPGGFNGGGDGGSPSRPSIGNYAGGAGGGGASDVRVGGTDLDHRIVVGGGGGGWGGFFGENAGVGGGTVGGDGADQEHSTGGDGGTQDAGGAGGVTEGGSPVGQAGALGVGGAGAGDVQVTNGGGGGGGGGYYGGGGGGGVAPGLSAAGPGGGGSGFGWDDVQSDVDAGNGGDGKVTLTYTPGDTSCVAAPLTITKVATGATTPGQTFTVHVGCTNDTIAFGDEELAEVDLQFVVDGAGVVQPAVGQTIGFYGENTCTVTETANGGAISTSYQCTGSGASDTDAGIDAGRGTWGVGAATAENPDDPCVTSGPQAEPMVVDIVSPNQQAAVTVTNTLPAIAPIVDVVPRFTG
jgi:hypothetical protein